MVHQHVLACYCLLDIIVRMIIPAAVVELATCLMNVFCSIILHGTDCALFDVNNAFGRCLIHSSYNLEQKSSSVVWNSEKSLYQQSSLYYYRPRTMDEK